MLSILSTSLPIRQMKGEQLLDFAFFCKFSIYLRNHLVYFNSNKLGVAPLNIIRGRPQRLLTYTPFLISENSIYIN